MTHICGTRGRWVKSILDLSFYYRNFVFGIMVLLNGLLNIPDFAKTAIAIFGKFHYSDVIIGAITSQITRVSIVYSTVCSGVDQRKQQSFASLAFVGGIHRWPVNSPHKGPVMRKMFPFDDVTMLVSWCLPFVRVRIKENIKDSPTHICRYRPH